MIKSLTNPQLSTQTRHFRFINLAPLEVCSVFMGRLRGVLAQCGWDKSSMELWGLAESLSQCFGANVHSIESLQIFKSDVYVLINPFCARCCHRRYNSIALCYVILENRSLPLGPHTRTPTHRVTYITNSISSIPISPSFIRRPTWTKIRAPFLSPSIKFSILSINPLASWNERREMRLWRTKSFPPLWNRFLRQIVSKGPG
jgi:hypothetical protein